MHKYPKYEKTIAEAPTCFVLLLPIIQTRKPEDIATVILMNNHTFIPRNITNAPKHINGTVLARTWDNDVCIKGAMKIPNFHY